MAVNAVCGVRDAHLYVAVPSEQQRQVTPDAQVCAAQFLVGVMAYARLGIGGPFLEIIIPLLTPIPEHPLERLPVCLGQHIHYPFEFLHKVPQQVSVCKLILEQHHSVLSAPICGIHQDGHFPW